MLRKKGDIKLVTGIILALVVLAIAMFIIRGGLLAGDASAKSLGACESRKGTCTAKDQLATQCQSPSTSLFKYGGCGSGTKEKLEYCCIPQEKQ